MLHNINEIITLNNSNYIILIFRTVMLLITLKFLNKIITLIFSKKVKTSRNIFLFHQRLTIFLNIIAFILIFVIWYPYLKNIITIISFISAGITIAIREVILNLFAGIYINATKPFKLEDRIEIDGIKGDVVVIKALSFKILEVGDRINGEQSSGLIINIPNSFIFSKSLKNYNTAFKYIWDEIVVNLNLDCNLEKNKEEILNIVNSNEVISKIPKKMNKAIEDASVDYRLYYNHLSPIIYSKIVDKHIELNVRFLVHPKKARIIEDDIWTKIIKKYKEGKIDIFKD